MKKLTTMVVAAAAALALGLTGCGGGGSNAAPGSAGGGKLEKTELKVGSLPLADYAALYWAKDKGFFNKEGLNVEIVAVQGGPVGIQKVASGELDMTNSTPFGTSMAANSGLPIKSVVLTSSLADKGLGVFVKPESPIKSMADLNGKSLGINTTRNMGDITFNNLAKSKGLDVKPNWVEVPFPEMIKGVQAGSIEAGYLPEPFASAARNAGLRQIADLTEGPNKGLAGSDYVASDKFVKSNPNTAAAFARAMYAAGADLNANEAAEREWLPGVAKLDPKVAQNMPLPKYYDSFKMADYVKAVDILKQQGLVKPDYKPEDRVFQPGK
ncbi:nitrate ABC transporter substrate-binding protein [Enemella dayhoffiae]|uniref:Nitrate ABC transporter substrate-binding protein n=1 Tax=Enemella dayhoffiae TaxID=2016507 RepID=A0A255GRB1_9ACTN|nr:ABC transporter substrate-binding protein [Enemella dayhoffiae]OYO18328.1 nitrate ABC transporter substrate-binding protein [Enemella dayhoffiae]